ncbi:hypothetical protein [Flexithrix dorotheae]|uniref:hypothetical protein n=1 Tax=Flexithrix dorotheae TaxID=70993 RepID=UPI00035CE085|nr:hypothetical protein [Flexithrix dorotheae]
MDHHQSEDLQILKICLKKIEGKLGWIPSEHWKQRDFEYLSLLIFQETHTTLSLSTLKRLWNQQYKSVPQVNTLNALAIFAGFEDWMVFKDYVKGQDIQSFTTFKNSNPNKIPSKKDRRNAFKAVFLITIPIIIIGSYLLSYFPNTGKNPLEKDFSNLDKVVFESKSMSTEVPNSVVFKYNISETDFKTAKIQQSWDKRLTQTLLAKNEFHTCIYYYPGYFNAKLILDDSVIKTHDVYVTTDGWQTLIEKEPFETIPTYIPKNKVRQNQYLYVNPETLASHKIETDKDYRVNYYYVKELEKISSDQFEFETEIKNSLQEGAKTCQSTVIGIMCKNGRINIPISAKGCISNNNLRFSEYFKHGKDHDLSAYSSNLNEWQKLKLVVNNFNVRVYLNGQKIDEFQYKESAGDIIGFRYQFLGCGAINSVKLTEPEGKIIFEDTFLN